MCVCVFIIGCEQKLCLILNSTFRFLTLNVKIDQF